MAYEMDAGAQRRMEEYFAEIGIALNNKKRREAFALYALGLFSELPRKSVEPIAAAVTRAVDGGVPGEIVLGDGDYGRAYELRTTVRAHGFDYGLGIHSSTRMWRLRR